jgi:hypothetical protein
MNWRDRFREIWGLPPLPPPEDFSWLTYILIKDLERCPYAIGEPGHSAWHERDDERLKKIATTRGWKSTPAQEK